jgi:hypothetical protein
MKTLSEKIGNIGKARRKRVEARAAVLMAEEMTLEKSVTPVNAWAQVKTRTRKRLRNGN